MSLIIECGLVLLSLVGLALLVADKGERAVAVWVAFALWVMLSFTAVMMGAVAEWYRFLG